jgi:hypothetical protein
MAQPLPAPLVFSPAAIPSGRGFLGNLNWRLVEISPAALFENKGEPLPRTCAFLARGALSFCRE